MVTRKLSNLEQAMEKLNTSAKTWNIVTISRIQGKLNPETIREALNLAQNRHPPLKSRIITIRGYLQFQTEGTTKIPLRILDSSPSSWEQVVKEEMNQPIDSSKCLMRSVFIYNHSQKHYFITTLHHAIADGLSSIKLHGEIFSYCQQVITRKSINLVPLPELPPVEELLPKWTQQLKGKISSLNFFLKIAYQRLSHGLSTLAMEKPLTIDQRQSNFIHRQLSQETTEKLVNKCRQANTTVTSALSAAIILVIAKQINQSKNKNINISCLTHIDLRRRLNSTISQEHMGVLASSIINFFTVSNKTNFWQLAQQVKQHITASSKNNDIFNIVLLAKHLINLTFSQVPATTSISNVGVIDIPKVYGNLELEEITFISSHALYVGMFVVQTSTFRGRMSLNFVFSEPAINRERIENIVNQLMHYISFIVLEKSSLHSLTSDLTT